MIQERAYAKINLGLEVGPLRQDGYHEMNTIMVPIDLYDELTFDKALEDHLKVMDQTAFALCREGDMPIIVFDMNQKGNLLKLVHGEKVGTLVHV